MSPLLLALALHGTTPGTAPHLPVWPQKLQAAVVKLTRSFSGELSLYVEDVETRARYGYNSETPMYLASGIKVPVMIALFAALERGDLTLDETMVLGREDVRDGSPLLSYLRPGTPMTLGILLEAMVRSSDNAATDLLIRRLGVDRVNRELTEQGFNEFGPITSLLDVRRLVYYRIAPAALEFGPLEIFDLRLVRPLKARLRRLESMAGLEDGELTLTDLDHAYRAYYLEGWNSGSMRAMGELLAEIARRRVVSPEASEMMLRIMEGTRTGTDRLRAGLPGGVAWAHKTGTQYQRTCDFGIAFYAGRSRPVVITASIAGPRAEAERLLARIGAAVTRILGQPAGRSRRASRP
ncbi:MAG: serine hydrolase [Myxococcota bacterium]